MGFGNLYGKAIAASKTFRTLVNRSNTILEESERYDISKETLIDEEIGGKHIVEGSYTEFVEEMDEILHRQQDGSIPLNKTEYRLIAATGMDRIRADEMFDLGVDDSIVEDILDDEVEVDKYWVEDFDYSFE